MAERGRMAQRWVWWALAGTILVAVLLVSMVDMVPTTATAEMNFREALNQDDPTVQAVGWNDPNPNAALRELLVQMQKRIAPIKKDLLVPLPPWNDATHKEADAALSDTFTLQSVTGTAPKLGDAGFDWSWRGPNDDPEFAWFLNRQHHIPALFVAWRETKDARYRTALNTQLRSWLAQSPRPGYYSFSAGWRALEVARRIEEAWLPVLFAPEASAALDDDVLSGMLADIPEHATALLNTHSFSGNHLVSEMTGLAAIALACPEFKDAPQWLDFAVTKVRAEAAREIYADGAENELSNLYQQVVLQELQHLVDMLTAARQTQDLADLGPLVENGWNYFANTLSPRGHGPLNNDSSVGDDAGVVRTLAAKYQRPDWQFIATQGHEGTAPPGAPTEFFPYAGLAVMRSGWDNLAQWAYFYTGPRGSDHQHADRLHVSIGGAGRDFLVDNGRYNYQPGTWRDYFTGPQGHNVILLDGQGTLRPPDTVDTPAKVRKEINADWDFFEATAPFAGDGLHGQGPAYHTRAVLYLNNHCWIIADRLLCAGPHELTAFWHFHPSCQVSHAGDLVYTDNPRQPNLGLLAVNAPSNDWTVELINGRQTPAPQGWYSRYFNEREPATCAEFSSTLASPRTLVWVVWIAPANTKVAATQPKVTVTGDASSHVSLKLQWPDKRMDTLTIPFAASTTVAWNRN